MKHRRRIVTLGAWLMWSVIGSFVAAAATSDWHPSKVIEYTIPADGTPPPWKSSKSRPDPFGITAGPDGNMWFTELQFNRLGKITPDGHVTQFPLPIVDEDTQPNPVQIVRGGDGALWFATLTGIGRITTDGRITMYPAAGDLTEGLISHIAPASDGAWFALGNLGHVGKNGVLTRYEHDPRDMIETIFEGPHHQVWALTLTFRQDATPPLALSKVLPDGSLRKILAFALPSGGLPNVSSIIAVPDGSFWISEGGGQPGPPYYTYIDQLFPDGHVVRRATLPSAYHVIEGPRGTVLVQGLDSITSISADGSLSTFDPHCRFGGLCIGGVVTAPNGVIWFTRNDGTGRIVKILP